uniref:Uncharacterized protein n=1 Tax=Klebsiella pneumoniae TaxID=573 RepID=A0A2P1BNW2_KLEPN|nr:hypothetical protein [Klebsiella pneumoniae]
MFNMAREAADNSPVIQAGQQIAEMVPTVQRMMSEQYSRSRFIRVFKDTGRHLGRWEVFSDFLSLAASELDMARIRTPEHGELPENLRPVRGHRHREHAGNVLPDGVCAGGEIS